MRLSGRHSITWRLTLLFASASSVVLLLLGFLIGAAVEQHFEDQDVELLTGKLELTRHALEKVHSPADLDGLAQQLDDSLVGHQGLAVVVVAPDGQTIFATRGGEFPQALLARPADAASARPVTWTTTKGQPLRGIATLVESGIKGAPPALVAVATDISHHQHFMASFRVTLWSFVVLAAVLTGVLGWIAARRGLAPLQAIKRQAADITARRLDARLPVDSVPLELLDLVETLNAMLTRLENSFRQLADFSSDLAHELRTPLSNLLTQTQVTLAKERTADAYRDVLASNVEEFERLSRMISDMLFLAKADDHRLVPHRETIDLAGEVQSLFEFYGVLAEEKAIALTRCGVGVVSGDRLMLRRALSNLLSNALRHTPAGGRIAVRIDPAGDSRFPELNPEPSPGLVVAVENSGPAIAAEHLPRLFDRFYRADGSRQSLGEGVGLGLAITRSIMRAHGGDVAVRSDQAGTVFALIIPAAAPNSPAQDPCVR